MKKKLTWIGCALLSFLVFAGLITAFIYLEDSIAVPIQKESYILYLLFHAFELLFIFSVTIIVSCLFVPKPKKYAAVTIVAITLILTIWAICFQLIKYGFRDGISYVFISSYIGVIVGLTLGVMMSHFIFKNKGWNQQPPKSEVAEFY
jgi:heme/copper-type cytochrome/quinol oxidase subunit 3